VKKGRKEGKGTKNNDDSLRYYFFLFDSIHCNCERIVQAANDDINSKWWEAVINSFNIDGRK